MTASTSADLLEHAIGATGELSIRVHSGEVQVIAVDGDLARIRDLDGRDLNERLVIEATTGGLTVRPRDRSILDLGFGLAGFGRSSRLAIEAPRAARLRIDTASAAISATGLRGEQRYSTASGEVDLTDVSGDIGVDAVSGDVEIRIAGEASLAARSVSGEVSVAGGRLRSVGLSTTSGDIELHSELTGPGPFAVQTVSGDASVAANRRLRIEASTVTGDISADGPQKRESGPGRRIVTVGDGGSAVVPFTFKSISGDLRVRAAGDTAREPVDDEPDDRATERLAILHDLETGAIDVETASARLAELEEGV